MLDRFLSEYALSVAGGLLFLIVAWFFAAWVRHLIAQSLSRNPNVDTSFVPVLAQAARIAIIIVAGLVVLDLVGVEVASIIAALGIFGFAIGLALRGPLSNIFNGVAIFSLKPYQTGDEIVADRVTGVVESVHLFHTVVVSEGSYLSVPNGVIWAKPLRNLSRPRPWRVDLNVSIDRTTLPADRDLKTVVTDLAATLRTAAGASTKVAPRARILDISEKAAVLLASAWADADRTFDLKTDMKAKLQASLESQGITVNHIKEPATPAARKPVVKRRVPAKPADGASEPHAQPAKPIPLAGGGAHNAAPGPRAMAPRRNRKAKPAQPPRRRRK